MEQKLSSDQVEELVSRFKARTLAKEEWTHEAHLTVGIWFVYHLDFFDALCQIKSGIITLNASFGGINDGNSGYHETLTVFWAKIMAEYIRLNELSFEETVNNFLSTPLTEKSLPFEFYEKEILLSPPFRAVFHEPAQKAIDPEAISALLSRI
jgi:hypothetical protein